MEGYEGRREGVGGGGGGLCAAWERELCRV